MRALRGRTRQRRTGRPAPGRAGEPYCCAGTGREGNNASPCIRRRLCWLRWSTPTPHRRRGAGCADSDSGLGTPATRAAIIDRLIMPGDVRRVKRTLVPLKRASRWWLCFRGAAQSDHDRPVGEGAGRHRLGAIPQFMQASAAWFDIVSDSRTHKQGTSFRPVAWQARLPESALGARRVPDLRWRDKGNPRRFTAQTGGAPGATFTPEERITATAAAGPR